MRSILRMVPVLCALSGVLVGVAPLQAQTRELRESAYSRALDLKKIASVCIAGSQCATNPVVKRVLDFYAQPFDSSTRVPSRATVDSALTERGKEAPGEAQADGSGMKLLSTEFVGMTRVAWALTDFVATRAKAELVQTAFRDLAKQSGRHPMDSLLPKSNALLARVDELQYRSVLPTLRAAFREDLRALPGRLETINASVIPDARMRQSLAVVSRASVVWRSIDTGADPLVAISEWGSKASTPLSLFEMTAAAIAFEARAVAQLGTNSSFEDNIEALASDASARPAFVAMLMESVGARQISTTAGKHEEAVQRVLAALTTTLEMKAAIDAAKMPGATDAERLSGRLRVVNATALLLRKCVGATDPSKALLDRGLALAVELWTAIDAQDYPRIVMLTVTGTQELAHLEPGALPTRVLLFAAAIASAEKSEDVESALEALADPVGSFRARRVDAATSVAVVSYVGASWGREQLLRATSKSAVNFGGASVPIGVELSRAVNICFVRSLGVHLAAIDLGTLLSYRLANDEKAKTSAGDEDVNDDPEVALSNIFAPSAMLTLGLTKNYPFTLGVGWQRAPRLRSLEGGDKVSARRVYVMLGVDLTLLKF